MIDTIIKSILSWLGKLLQWSDIPSFDRIPEDVPYIKADMPPIMAPTASSTPKVENATETDETLLWDTPKRAWRSVRVLCDEMELTYEQKNLICACIFQESRFSNAAIGRNNGSIDWGIVQVNDYWHIGKGKTWMSVEFVVNNPEKMVRWMIRLSKQGQLYLWSSYKHGAYKQWLAKGSKMWELAK